MFSKHSSHIQKALKQIENIKGKNLTFDEREKEAVELASQMLQAAVKDQTFLEKKKQGQLARMMNDPMGKAFTTCMTDQCFRSNSPSRVANQLIYLLNSFGIPKYLNLINRCGLRLFQCLAPFSAPLLVPLVTIMLRKETSSVILPGEPRALSKHMKKRREQGVRINLNHLGEAILGEEESNLRLNLYLSDLARPDVEYISIKISTIFSQINLIDWENTLDTLSDRLKLLYRAAMTHVFTKANGEQSSKFVNLDMEEYRDLHLTKELFKKVLSEPEFLQFSAGIVLQAYLPDCFLIQQELTKWAQERISTGGAPVKIRIVKGANLSMEQFEASVKGWPQAPYKTKLEVDANYKKMVTYGCKKENADAVHLGIASHNLFDIAYAMLLRAENNVEEAISFEMLEGMADHIRRVVQILSKDILLYCPVATKKDFQSAIAYLIRRLDENTGPENFLRYTFGLKPGSTHWLEQVKNFSSSCKDDSLFIGSRRTQNRFEEASLQEIEQPFKNEPDTDFSLANNREWAMEIVNTWENKLIDTIPCYIGENEASPSSLGERMNPSKPDSVLYKYSLAGWEEVNQALEIAKEEESSWQQVSAHEKANLLANVAKKMRELRGEFIGVMMTDGAKTLAEADPEVSEAIDFAEYYLRSLLDRQKSPDLEWEAKGTVLITPPWNFPIAIPAGGILSALASGNCVIFKPAPEAILSGWILINALWDAGISKKVLQFLSCSDDPVGSQLIADKRINMIILTGATSTARLFMKIRPDLDLSAETGGKNAIIITALSDRDLAIKDLIQSAFGHSGQKCSAASLAILEAEVYDNPHFRAQLKDAVLSLKVGSPWNLGAKVTPLIRAAEGDLLKALTTLEAGESWLVEPKQSDSNPNLWSPGIKMGVKPNSFMHKTEFFGPILAIMRADNLDHAITLANATSYGLTSGINSLDKRELQKWLDKIEAGNLYINRGITGAIVKRQPFGGCKASSFGHGLKAGGPNYLSQLATPSQETLPKEKTPLPEELIPLTSFLGDISFSAEDLGMLYGSQSNYAFWALHMPTFYDLDKPKELTDLVLGQDNALYYKHRPRVVYRVQETDSALDILRIISAALCAKTPLEISWSSDRCAIAFNADWTLKFPLITFKEESEDDFFGRVSEGIFERIRLISSPSEDLRKIASETGCFLDIAEVLANGHLELLHHVREVSLSYDYHRYGNLGLREQEKRNPVL